MFDKILLGCGSMNKNKKQILINLFVICLYFIWPYFLNSITSLFDISHVVSLYISFSVNFIFLFIIIYIYRKILNRYYEDFIGNNKKVFINCIKIFVIGLFLYVLLNTLLDVFNVPIFNNQNSMIEMFKNVPVLFVLNTLFYYPVIEELVFKMSLKEIIKNKWSFIIITGLLNAFFQIFFSMNNVSDLLYLLPLTFLISSLSYVYHKTDNVIYPIVLRMCYNLIPCIIYMIDLIQV